LSLRLKVTGVRRLHETPHAPRSSGAALLLIPSTGFLPADDGRMRRTINRIRAELGHDDLVYRYLGPDGVNGTEGTFVACSFWLAQALAASGRTDEAIDIFEGAVSRANDVGLLPEVMGASSGRFLGNFPQGLSHIALVNAATAIARAQHTGGNRQ
jgi:GH15 family glucan-1,4-alpha-glucosidase